MKTAAAVSAGIAIGVGAALTFASHGSGARSAGLIALVAGMASAALLLLPRSRSGARRRGDRRRPPIHPRTNQDGDQTATGSRQSPSPGQTHNAPQPYPPSRHGYERPAPEGAYRPREAGDRRPEHPARYTTRH